MGFGVFSTFASLVLTGPFVDVFGVACVEASVMAFKDVNVKQHTRAWHSYSGDKQSNTTPFCIALFR